MQDQKLTPEQLDTAERALRWVFPGLLFERASITPDAAFFAFAAMRKLNIGSRAALALFKLVTLPLQVSRWSDIPKQLFEAVKEALRDPKVPMASRIARAIIVDPHQRNMQRHLNDPDIHPCPAFDARSLW